MKQKIINWILIRKNGIIDFVLIISAFLSIWSYLRFIPIIIFLVNFITFKRHLKVTFVFFSIAVGLTIFSLIINPIIEKRMKEAMKIGFHPERLAESQENLDLLARNIEIFKNKYGYYPKTLNDVQKNSMIKDVSYYLTDNFFDTPFYYYELIDSSKYYLAGIGKDGIPKTNDDILPIKSK